MSPISELLWQSEFPDIPIPEGCNYTMFTAACKQKSSDLNRVDHIDFIRQLKQANANQDIINELIETERNHL